jgi:thymidylate synthase ThyX
MTDQTRLEAKPVTIIGKEGPIISVLAEMAIIHEGVQEMADWVKRYRPNCVPEGGFEHPLDLVPHDGTEADGHAITANELLCELAGRKCYDSFADSGAKRTNREYLASMWQGQIPHRSTGYHAKMTFFFAHISRRVSHELIRNYVGADRDEEGSPSQESTRFTHHPGCYIAPVRDLDDRAALEHFEVAAQENYTRYCDYIRGEANAFEDEHGHAPKGMDRKRIYEAASNYLMHSCATSFIWTTNPMALAKFFAERDHEAADAEIQRFAHQLKLLCLDRWPNLFPFVER